MKQPYLMTRDEWYNAYQSAKPDGMPRYKSNRISGTISKIDCLEFLLFGINKWLIEMAYKGELFAIEAIQTGIYNGPHTRV